MRAKDWGEVGRGGVSLYSVKEFSYTLLFINAIIKH